MKDDECYPGSKQVPIGGVCERCGVESVWSEKEGEYIHPYIHPMEKTKLTLTEVNDIKITVSPETANALILAQTYSHLFNQCLGVETASRIQSGLYEIQMKILQALGLGTLTDVDGNELCVGEDVDVRLEAAEVEPEPLTEETIERQIEMLRENGSYLNCSTTELRIRAIEILEDDIPF